MRSTVYFAIILSFAAETSAAAPRTALNMQAVFAGAVQQGNSFADSIGTIATDNGSVLLTHPKGSKCDSYTVKFDPSMIMTEAEKQNSPLKGLAKDCIILKQHAKSNLAQLIFCPNGKESAELILGEGMPIRLAKFYPPSKVGKLESDYKALRKDVWTGKAPEAPGQTDRDLTPVDLALAERILKGTDSEQKIKVLKDLSSNIWTAIPSTIEKRFRLIQTASTDRNPDVQVAALEVFDYSGRVPEGVPLLKQLVDSLSNQSPSVQKKIAESLVSLLYSADRAQALTFPLTNRYSTDKPSEILRKSQGIIDAKDVKGFEELCEARTGKTTWTLDQLRGLRAELSRVFLEPKADSEARQIATRGLAEYKDFGTKEESSKDPAPTRK